MKKLLVIVLLSLSFLGIAQNVTQAYKKRVLEAAEVNFLSSYYEQDGNNAAVTGGIGTEKLTDFTPTIVISLPVNADDVLTIDAGISAYSSASSSNLNPFDSSSGASNGREDDDDEKDDDFLNFTTAGSPTGSPWSASSGASQSDVWGGVTVDYSHSSDNRNTIINADVSVASEYDYFSFGFGGGITQLFNEKNTTFSLIGKVYLDNWHPKYPTELDSYNEVGGNLNDGFFQGIDIYNQAGNIIDKSMNSPDRFRPISASGLIDNTGRNSYSISVSFSQILSRNAHVSFFFDLVQQKGWLANPMQRVYFADRPNYYIGAPESIPIYTSPQNRDVFQLADDIERLPDSRFKIPVGVRLNYYLNEMFVLRTYYRYYTDDWGVDAHTAEIELPIKISSKFTLYPSYRYYNQNAADYFSEYETHVSSSPYYTSDFDLSKFNAMQYGFGVNYTDIFTSGHIWKLGIKSVDVQYNNYRRNTGLKANIVTAGIKFVMD